MKNKIAKGRLQRMRRASTSGALSTHARITMGRPNRGTRDKQNYQASNNTAKKNKNFLY